MKPTWTLQDAKARFSQVVDEAIKSGPQFVTRRGQPAVVVVSAEEYGTLVSNKPTLKEFLLRCPKMDDDFEIERPQAIPGSIRL
jgi:antitoxin Phd